MVVEGEEKKDLMLDKPKEVKFQNYLKDFQKQKNFMIRMIGQ